MTKKIKEEFVVYKKNHLMISFIEYIDMKIPEKYEVGVFNLDKNFEEMELMTNLDYENGLFYFNKYLNKYSQKVEKEKKIPQRYITFVEDYYDIFQRCSEYFKRLNITTDEGTSNLDYLKVFIGKRLNHNFLMRALKEKNLKAVISNGWILLDIPLRFQGFYRTEQCRYMKELFQEKGYIVELHYQMD